MRRLLLLLLTDTRRHLKSPLALMIYIAIPLFLTGIIGLVFAPRSEESQLPPINILLVDNDKFLASRFLMGAMDSDPVKKMFRVTLTDGNDGERKMKNGKASAMVIIPKGFTVDIIDGKDVSLTVVKNPSEQFLPNIVEEFMKTLSVMLSGAVQAFHEEAQGIRFISENPLETLSWKDLGPQLESAQKKFIAAGKYLSPLFIRLEKEKAEAKGAKVQLTMSDLFGIIFPGMIIMFLLFIVNNRMGDLLSEREDGKLRRLLTTPIATWELIFARILGGWIWGMGIVLIMVTTGSLLFRIHWGSIPSLLLLGLAASFWTASFFAFLFSLLKNRNQAGAISSPIILVFSVFGGSMLPPASMPKAFQTIGFLTPNRWFIDGASRIRDGLFPLPSLMVLILSGLLFLALAVPALKRRSLV
ncbi:MAG TPA: ABC transporter permease [Candidatus Aminicenantes bacterium]|nr:ABC transporter permease [Candidatus Aminicenantes bacterium]HPT00652.1 ABC transporter permease [Candidatus Aminicenantes bacterium]